ncbi:phosphotransferase family protein [Streptomyces johnsoniae]|uniref:Aminoglycoside phosphotransferase family protein n=1 Tax=Streptomyces johnsoniae TaxID=3075532 RepID=A0ABU2RZ77_9ACTN|nr:aminoglycoside phosphotransferase family protein [Streptomyces sp. DSM 41886]MDT0442076.1 aminoglycoside phosphotransferase family protein [Streptomyces sp. DSM 41886]
MPEELTGLTELTAQAAGAFRVVAERSAPAESRSGAGVHAVRTAEGRAAYLKATPTALGPRALAAARRELRFYRVLAPLVPLRTPRLLDFLDTAAGVALLLAAAGEPKAAASWTDGMWAGLGRDLAALHRTPLPAGDWAGPDPLLDALDAPDLAGITAFWGAALPGLPGLLDGRAELRERITALPRGLIHGDCHADNILYTAGTRTYLDWQAAGVGRPVADLAFLSVRATPSGTVVPRALADAYLTARPCDRRAFTRALVAEELGVLLFLWPPFAAFHTPEGIARVHRRARVLGGAYGEAVGGRGG